MIDLDHNNTEHINICVGNNIETRRKLLQISQSDLGKCVQVSHQQIHKYETGETRIPLDKIYLLSEALNCKLEELFKGVKIEQLTNKVDIELRANLLDSNTTKKLIKHYISIEDEKTRSIVIQIVKHFSLHSKKEKVPKYS